MRGQPSGTGREASAVTPLESGHRNASSLSPLDLGAATSKEFLQGAPLGWPLAEVLQRPLSLRAAATVFFWRAADNGAVPRGRVRPSTRSIARGKSNFQLVELVPLRFRSVFIRYGEKGLQALVRGNSLRSIIHARIVPCTTCHDRS